MLRLTLCLVLCAGTGIGLWSGWEWLKMTSLFTCCTVEVRGNSLISREEILDKIAIVPGQSIFAYNREVIVQSLAGNPYIGSCQVRRIIPSTLAICIAERSPLAYVNLDQPYLVDQDRVLLPVPRNGVVFDLPVITGLGVTARPGHRVYASGLDEALGFLTAILALRPDLAARISEINAADHGTSPWS